MDGEKKKKRNLEEKGEGSEKNPYKSLNKKKGGAGPSYKKKTQRSLPKAPERKESNGEEEREN